MKNLQTLERAIKTAVTSKNIRVVAAKNLQSHIAEHFSWKEKAKEFHMHLQQLFVSRAYEYARDI